MRGKQRPFGLSSIPIHANINLRYSLRLPVIVKGALLKDITSRERGCGLRLSTLRKGVLFKTVYNEERGVV